MARRIGPWVLSGAAFAAVTAAVACLDVTPVTVSSSIGDDGSAPDDAATDAIVVDAALDGDAARGESCVACLNTQDDAGAGCAEEVAACAQNAECAGALTCAENKGCFQLGSINALIACGYPCAQEAGIITLSDPAINLAFNVFQCAGQACSGPCKIMAGD